MLLPCAESSIGVPISAVQAGSWSPTGRSPCQNLDNVNEGTLTKLHPLRAASPTTVVVDKLVMNLIYEDTSDLDG